MNSELPSAIHLYKSGERDAARRAVAALCKATPHDGDVWYAAAMMSDSAEQKRKLLERALAADPFHERADAALKKLAPSPNAPKAKASSQRPIASKQPPIALYAAVGLCVVVLVGLLIYAGSGLLNERGGAGGSVALPTATNDPGVLLTRQAQATQDMAAVPLATETALAATQAIITPTATATPAPFEITATAYLYAAQTAQADLRLTATAASSP
jgi:ferric-dicitrate binding protein FerR (iron transport regulator)